jgi:hypothetical protein
VFEARWEWQRVQPCHCEALLREHLRKPQHAKEHAHRCVHACVVVLGIFFGLIADGAPHRPPMSGDNPWFKDLEASLRSFVLGKCTKSKLNLVSTYLSNLLSDIELLVGSNAIVVQEDIVRAKVDLDAVLVLERMKSNHQVLEDALEAL